MRNCLSLLVVVVLGSPGMAQEMADKEIPKSRASSAIVRQYVPAHFITTGPGFHWFGYYDKSEFDPTGRYVLANQVTFENRQPTATDTIRVGMVDTWNDSTWIELGESRAWGWQQGCMLQFIPGSDKVIWNDRQGDQFVSHIVDIRSKEKRTLPFPVYALSSNGVHAVSLDFERVNNLRRGYGYAGIADPNAGTIAPANAGIYLCNLRTGEKKLIISLARMMKLNPFAASDPIYGDFESNMHWFNHLLFNPDGTRFVFLHRWKATSRTGVGGFGTLMYTSDLQGNDIRLIDPSGYTSHFIWRDNTHLMAWTRFMGTDGFYLFEDGGGSHPVQEGKGIMTRNGHNTYLPTGTGTEWILNDEYPDNQRIQQVYLYHVPTKKRIPLGDFFLDPKYHGEWRVDTHPRSSPDGTKVVIDCPNGEQGRQLLMLDISAIVGAR